MPRENFISDSAAQLIIEVSRFKITDNDQWTKWNIFDNDFIDHAIKEIPNGFDFDRKAAKAFLKPENSEILRLCFRIYIESCKKMEDKTTNDYKFLNTIAQIYSSARMTLIPKI